MENSNASQRKHSPHTHSFWQSLLCQFLLISILLCMFLTYAATNVEAYVPDAHTRSHTSPQPPSFFAAVAQNGASLLQELATMSMAASRGVGTSFSQVQATIGNTVHGTTHVLVQTMSNMTYNGTKAVLAFVSHVPAPQALFALHLFSSPTAAHTSLITDTQSHPHVLAAHQSASSGSPQQTNRLPLLAPIPVSYLSTTNTNLLHNSSFEVQTNGQPREWQYQLDSTTGNTFISQEGNRSGTFGLKFVGGGTGNFGISQPTVKTVPGRAYSLSLYIKVVNAPSIRLRMGLWNEYLNQEGEMKTFSYAGTHDWTRISVPLTTPGLITDPKNEFPLIEVEGLTTGAVYLDDVQLEEGSVLTDYNSAQAKNTLAGDGSVVFTSGGDILPTVSGNGQLGSATNQFSALHLTNAAIDSNGNLSLNGGFTANGSGEIKGPLTLDSTLTIKGNTTFTGSNTFNNPLVFSAYSTGILHSDSNGNITSSAVNLNSNDITNTLQVGNGGTGVSSFTQYGVLYGNGTSALQVLSPGTSGYVLQTNGNSSAPSWVSASGLSAGSVPFSGVTTGINTNQTLTVGNGTTLSYSGTGVLNANQLLGNTWASPGPIGNGTAGTGAFTTLSGTAITGTTFNGLTITNNGSNTLSISNGKTLTANNSLTIAGVDGKILTINKNLTFDGTDNTSFTFPSATDTIVGRNSTDTLTNKSIAAGSNTISGLTNTNLSGSAGITNANLANSSLTLTAGTGLSGGGSVSLGGSVTINNAGVLSLTGTTNQVNVSGSTGNITLSLPQSINSGASPSFASLNLTNTSNQLALGTTNIGTITWSPSTARTFTIPDVTGTAITTGNLSAITSTGTINSGTWNGTAIGAQYGGTGQNWSSVAQGNVPYFSGTGTLAALAPGTANQLFITNGALANPSWTNISSLLTAGTDVSLSGTTNVTIGDTSTLATVTGRGATTSTNVTFNGNITEGQTSANTITPNGVYAASLIPQSTSINLGSSGSPFGTVYANTMVTTASSGQVGFWQLNAGVLSPATITNQLAIGQTTALANSGIDVEVNSKGNAALVVANTGGSGDIFTASSGASPKFVINSAGNVGVGTTTPGANWGGALATAGMELAPPNNKTATLGLISTGGNGGQIAFGASGAYTTTNGGAIAFNYTTAGALEFFTNGLASNGGSSRMIITNGGNLGINTTNPSSFKLQVAGDVGPDATDTYNLGSASKEWNNLYVKNVITSATSGQEGFWQRTASGGFNYLAPNTTADLLSIGQTTGLTASGLSVKVNALGNAAGYIENTGSGPLFTASASGSTKFTVDNGGNVTSNGFFQSNATNGAGAFYVQNFSNSNGEAQFVGNWVPSGRWGMGPATGANENTVRIGNSDNVGNWSSTQNLSLLIGGATSLSALKNSGLDIETNGLGNSVLVANNSGGSGDIFTASSAGSPKFVINSAGNVGVGTTTPNSPLHVISTIAGGNATALTLGNAATTNNTGSQIAFNLSTSTTAIEAFIRAVRTNLLSGGSTYLSFGTSAGASSNEVMRLSEYGGAGFQTSAIGNGALVVNQPNSSGDIFSASQSGSTKFVINNNGNLGIGSTSPNYKLDTIDTQNSTSSASITNLSTSDTASTNVLALNLGTVKTGTNSRFIQFYAGANSSTNAVGVGRIQLNNGNVAYNTGGADFAEYFSKGTNPLTSGDIVTIDTDGSATLATPKTGAIGIVSTTAGFIGNAPHDPNQEQEKVVVGLVGQLSVKVSTENGNIQAGDLLTLSSTPGVAMKATKAGAMIGRALESYTNADSHAVGTIQVLINISYADSNIQIALTNNGDLSVNGQVLGNTLPTPTNTNALIASSTLPSATIQNTPSTVPSDQLNTLSTTVSGLQSQIASMSAQLGKIDDLSKQLADVQKTVNLNQTLQGIGTSSAVLGTSTEDTTIGGKLTVLGRTVLSDVGVTGTINTGLLTINGMDTISGTSSATINTLAGPLKLQSLALGGIDLFNGKVTIDTSGNIQTSGTVTAKKYTVDTSDSTSASVGEAVIPAGHTSVEVKTSAVSDKSNIFVTIKGGSPIPISVLSQKAGTSFTVEVAEQQSQDVKFNWWIVN